MRVRSPKICYLETGSEDVCQGGKNMSQLENIMVSRSSIGYNGASEKIVIMDLMIDFHSKCALAESPKTQCWPLPNLILGENRSSNPLINTPL